MAPPLIRSPSNINVVMGITNLYIPTSVTLNFAVSAFVYNSDFNTFNFNNDIAMILVIGEIPYGDFAIYPIALPTIPITVNSSCTVSGWGATYENVSKFLRFLKVEEVGEFCRYHLSRRITHKANTQKS